MSKTISLQESDIRGNTDNFKHSNGFINKIKHTSRKLNPESGLNDKLLHNDIVWCIEKTHTLWRKKYSGETHTIKDSYSKTGKEFLIVNKK